MWFFVLILFQFGLLASDIEFDGRVDGLKQTARFYSPEKECELFSESGTKSIEVTFGNELKESIKLFWVDFDGKMQSYGELNPGKKKKQRTYRGHSWVVKNANGDTLVCLVCNENGWISINRKKINSLPNRRPIKLPSRVDNSSKKFFPPVVKQRWNTCSQEAAIYYIFTYEMNYVRNKDGYEKRNQYPATWAWNFVNNGTNQGSEVVEGWHVASEMGVPSVSDYGESGSKGTSGWMGGYDRYYRAMKNRVESWEFFKIVDQKGLVQAKRWLFNHNNPELSTGGLLAFDFPPSGRVVKKIPAGQYESGKTIVTKWGRGGGHLMTYVGYDDNVGFDFNGDGKITNDKDITGDGKITIADWERGCFIMVNSWGDKWGDRGRAYVPYRSHFITKRWSRGEWLANVRVKKSYQPKMTLRLDFQANHRSAVRLKLQSNANNELVGTVKPLVFSDRSIVQRPKTSGPEGYSSFLSSGRSTGRFPLEGKKGKARMEMGFDVSELLTSDPKKNNDLRFSLALSAGRNAKDAGLKIHSAKLMEYDPAGKVVKVRVLRLMKKTDGEVGGKSKPSTIRMEFQSDKVSGKK